MITLTALRMIPGPQVAAMHKAVRAMHRDGFTDQEIASERGVYLPTVQELTATLPPAGPNARRGGTLRRALPIMTADQRADIVRRRQAGETVQAIAREPRRPLCVIRAVLWAASQMGTDVPGIRRNAASIGADRIAEIIDLVGQGVRYRDIAVRLDMPEGTVINAIWRLQQGGVLKPAGRWATAAE